MIRGIFFLRSEIAFFLDEWKSNFFWELFLNIRVKFFITSLRVIKNFTRMFKKSSKKKFDFHESRKNAISLWRRKMTSIISFFSYFCLKDNIFLASGQVFDSCWGKISKSLNISILQVRYICAIRTSQQVNLGGSLVEHWTCNQEFDGSIPPAANKTFSSFFNFCCTNPIKRCQHKALTTPYVYINRSSSSIPIWQSHNLLFSKWVKYVQ